jgi:cytoskeletal protein RodZ
MKGSDSTQVERLQEIAEYLHQQRQHQGVSLEAVAKATYIPQRILQALESAQLEILPEPVYVKGFIRRYADVLGLDGMMIADAFEIEPALLAHAAPKVQPEPIVESARPFSQPVEQRQPEQPVIQSLERTSERFSERTSDPTPERSPKIGLSYLPWVGAGIAALALGALAFNLFTQPKKPLETGQSTINNPAASSNSATPGANSSPSSSAAIAPQPTTSPLSAETPVQVDLSLTDRSWLEVTVDGKVDYEGTLDKGTQRTWKAKKNISIVVGNAGAVMASFNQGEAKLLGKAGDVATVKFPAQ